MIKSRIQMSGAISAIIILIVSMLIAVSFKTVNPKVKKFGLNNRDKSVDTEFKDYSGYEQVLKTIEVSDADIQHTRLSPKLVKELNKLARRVKNYGGNFYIYDAQGNIFNKDGKKLNFNVKDLHRAYFNATFNQDKQFYVSPPFTSAVTGKKVLGITYKSSGNIAILASIQQDLILKAQVMLLF